MTTQTQQDHLHLVAADAQQHADQITGPVGALLRDALKAAPEAAQHEHSHDHGNYEHYCEK